MKTRTSPLGLFASLTAASLVALSGSAQTAAPAVTSTPPAGTAAVQPKLPYGVDDVLRLSRAQVSEDVIVNFVRGSGTVYNLGSSDIVYLRNEGVSDRVITAMMDQRKTVSAEAAAQAASAPAPAPAPAPVAAQPVVAAAPQYAPVYVAPPPAPAASTVYVMPYGGGSYGYANTYPYYTYFGPSVSVGFGFSSGYCGGYSHGYYGYRGGYYGGRYGHYGHH